MAQKINYDTVLKEYQMLREQVQTVQLATIDKDNQPEASYAPFVWHENACFLFLSQLARHTQNLNSNPAISLLIIEAEKGTGNPFARRRINWQGEASGIDRGSELYQTVMNIFRQRFGDFIDVIEPLQDFQLFRIEPKNGRFIRGFAQAFELSGASLNEFNHINPNGEQ